MGRRARDVNAALSMNYDFIVIGGGIVGAATAWQLLQTFPDKRVVVLEKESRVACHQPVAIAA